MLHCYVISQDKLRIIPSEEAATRSGNLIWIDLLEPSPEEEQFVETLLQANVPTRDEMHEIELSSRLYVEQGALYATTTVINHADTEEPQARNITFVLKDNCLVTVRYSDPQPFRTFYEWASRENIAHYKGNTILIGLVDAMVGRVADVLEDAGCTIDLLTKCIFRPRLHDKTERSKSKPDFEDMLRRIGICGDLLSKTQESLVSLTRMLNFIAQTTWFPAESNEALRIKTLLHDIRALNDYVTFLSNKVFFLLDAVLGMTSIEQNKIIKIFSVVAVIFLPPTLIASIYGMNFHFLPELDWPIGYPLALGGMALSAVLPLVFFRKKGWL